MPHKVNLNQDHPSVKAHFIRRRVEAHDNVLIIMHRNLNEWVTLLPSEKCSTLVRRTLICVSSDCSTTNNVSAADLWTLHACLVNFQACRPSVDMFHFFFALTWTPSCGLECIAGLWLSSPTKHTHLSDFIIKIYLLQTLSTILPKREKKAPNPHFIHTLGEGARRRRRKLMSLDATGFLFPWIKRLKTILQWWQRHSLDH